MLGLRVNFSFSKYLPQMILIVVCFFVYSHSLRGNFISDDVAIIRNISVSPLWHFWADPSGFLTALTYLFLGLNPIFYHFTNILIHGLNTILVFLILRIFFEVKPSLLGSLLFAVHPVHSEAVSWISGRGYLVIGLFTLSCYLLYYSATKAVFNFRRYIICFLLYLYFMIIHYVHFSLFPVLFILSDIIFNRWQKNWRLWLPFLLIIPIRVFFARQVIINRIEAYGQIPADTIAWGNSFLNAVYSFFTNLYLLIWPQKLVLYQDIPETSLVVKAIEFVLFGILILAIPFLYRRFKVILFGLVFFLLSILPGLSPFRVCCTLAERYLYLAPILLVVILALLYKYFQNKGRVVSIRIFSILALCIIAAYAARAIERDKDWLNPQIFWRNALKSSPNNSYVHSQVGYMNYLRGNLTEAIKEYKKAIDLFSGNFVAHNNLGIVYNVLSNQEEAILSYQNAIKIKPDFTEAYFNLGNAYNALGNKQEAVLSYQKAITINPRFVEGYFNLGKIHVTAGRQNEAVEFFQKVIVFNPKFLPAYQELVFIYSSLKKNEDVLLLYNKAIAQNLQYYQAYLSVAYDYIKRGREKEAIALLKKSIRINPESYDAYAALGWAYCVVGNIPGATQASKKALELNPSSGMANNNLAAAYFYAKDYQLAEQYIDRAVELGYPVTAEILELIKPLRKK